MGNQINIFELSYTWYEDHNSTFLVGPDMPEEDFNNLCKSLLPRAGKRAIKNAVKNGEDMWLGWDDVIKALAEILKGHGFEEAEIKSFSCWGSTIIRKSIYEDINEYKEGIKMLGKSLDLIDAYNQKIEDKAIKDVEERYGSSTGSGEI